MAAAARMSARIATFPAWAENEVRCRGEALAPVLWQGRQWAVTEFGIECRAGTYYIEAHRLYQDEPGYSWVWLAGSRGRLQFVGWMS